MAPFVPDKGRGEEIMNLEKPNTLDRPDLQENMPSFQMEEASPSGKPKKRGWLWLVILVLVGLGVFFYYRSHPNSAKAASDAAQSPAVRTGQGGGRVPVVAALARKGDIGVYLIGLGAVTPIYTVTMKSQIPGYLMSVLYREGQIVKKGDLLAQIDPRPYQVMLENAEAMLARDQANLQNAIVDQKRYQTLVPLKAVPEQQLATQDALVKSTEATVKADQAQIDNAKLDLTYCQITAPITGRVGLRLVDPGNYVTPTDATGLVVITQIEPISVIFTLAEDQLPEVLDRMNAGARLQVEAYDRQMTKKIAQGWLETVDNQIDPTTGTVKLRANFDNRDGALFPNQFVNARLLVEEKKGVTLIPTAAVQRNSQITYAYLVKDLRPARSASQETAEKPRSASQNASEKTLDGTVTIKTIIVGTSEGDQSEATSGIAPGDVVVMTGVDRLQEGTKVRVQMSGEKTATIGQ
jgi:multidrug efflux system membrane fusion protein